jgi:RNA polymerase sigma-70 factor (ECF subfamily)
MRLKAYSTVEVTDAARSIEPQSLFVTTRWSVVLSARDQDCPDSAAALETLCASYWYPIYAFVRGQGRTSHDAQDLTQEFFARLLEKEYLKAVSPEKGRFRTFLRVALKRFLANEWDRSRTLKRGGGQSPLSLDALNAEERYSREPRDSLSPDRIYERRWAMLLLEQTISRLRAEYQAAGKMSEFEILKAVLNAERNTIAYGQFAASLQISEGAARVAAHRMRKRFRELFRAAVADTVSEPSEVEDELRYLAGILQNA